MTHDAPYVTYSIADNANRIARSQTRQAHRETRCHVHKSSKQRVLLVWWRLDVASDEDGDDERVDGENTGHDNGDE